MEPTLPAIPEESPAIARLKQDYLRLKSTPVPYVQAEPLPENILEWHFVLRGPEDTLYEGGLYHGKLIFPPEFPAVPPGIYMITPNGRFETEQCICFTVANPGFEDWDPRWNATTVLIGIMSFMLDSPTTLGSITDAELVIKQHAYQSLEWNIQNQTFCQLFPNLAEEVRIELEGRIDDIEAEERERQREQEPMEQLEIDEEPTQTAAQSSSKFSCSMRFILQNIILALFIIVFGLIVKYIIKDS